MDAKELRIGNIIGISLETFDQNYFKVLEVAQDAMKVSACGLRFDLSYDIDYHDAIHFEGIPITEELLVILGFGKSDDHEYGNNQHSKFGFYYDTHFKVLNLDCGDADSVNITMSQIKYVHQLQNLYFALTGTELYGN
jgi:hypothetical protein